MIRARSTRFVGSVRDREISATVAAAPHQSAAQSLAAVLPLDPPIQSPALLLRHLVEISKLYPNILIFWNLCTRLESCSNRPSWFCRSRSPRPAADLCCPGSAEFQESGRTVCSGRRQRMIQDAHLEQQTGLTPIEMLVGHFAV